MESSQGIFENVREFPDPGAQRKFSALVGIDNVKERLLKEARAILNPLSLDEWSKKHYKKSIPLVQLFRERPPLVVFAGDVGTGKSELAKSIGDPVARASSIPVFLYSLSLNARGSGAVGEMTRLLSMAFAEVHSVAKKARDSKGRFSSAYILLIDEADAIAQSRESAQMHHEDRAGVNAVIRGIDTLTDSQLPIMVVMCTNRLNALDPAICRRATAIFEFRRPSEDQRVAVLSEGLAGTGLKETEIHAIAKATGSSDGKKYGYTYSDLRQRLLPAILFSAYPDEPVTAKHCLEVAKNIAPTPPFSEKDLLPAAT